MIVFSRVFVTVLIFLEPVKKSAVPLVTKVTALTFDEMDIYLDNRNMIDDRIREIDENALIMTILNKKKNSLLIWRYSKLKTENDKSHANLTHTHMFFYLFYFFSVF